MLFHEKLDVKLIRLVKDNPVLYDYKNVKYMDFNAREVAWQKIGDELKRPAAVCKVRWINIRDVYRRILKRNTETGHRVKVYKYENEVCFLRRFYKEVTVQNDGFESDDKSQINEDFDDDDGVPESNSDHFDEPLTKIKIKKSGKSNSKKKKRQKTITDDTESKGNTISFNESAIPTELDSSDPVDSFLLSIGATLKTFSSYHLNLAKSKIFNVVQEHDLQQIVQKQQHNDTSSHDIKVPATETLFME